jgi:hypothetical protein
LPTVAIPRGGGAGAPVALTRLMFIWGLPGRRKYGPRGAAVRASWGGAAPFFGAAAEAEGPSITPCS